MINNWQAREIHTAEEARRGLYEQVPNTVLWAASVRRLEAQGVTRAIEVGAGGVLTGLLRGIAPAISGQKFGEAAELEKARQAVA